MGFNGRLSGAGGSITIYTGDDTIADPVRNVQVGTTLNFLYGAAGVNGSVQMTTGGYFKNQTSIASNYWQYDNVNGIMSLITDTHTVTGIRAENGGGIGNPTAKFDMFAGSNGTCYLDIATTTSIFYFLTNNTGTLAGCIYGTPGTWGIGGLAEYPSSLLVTGRGTTSATNAQRWVNSVGSELKKLMDTGDSTQVGDIETTTIGKGFILKAPDGTRWRITIDNAGSLTTALA
jgi:hypothetical protein